MFLRSRVALVLAVLLFALPAFARTLVFVHGKNGGKESVEQVTNDYWGGARS